MEELILHFLTRHSIITGIHVFVISGGQLILFNHTNSHLAVMF